MLAPLLSPLLTFAPVPIVALVVSFSTLTDAEPATPTLPPPEPATAKESISSKETATTAKPFTFSVLRFPSTLLPVKADKPIPFPLAVTMILSPRYASIVLLVIVVTLAMPTAALEEIEIFPAKAQFSVSSLAEMSSVPSTLTGFVPVINALLVLVNILTETEPPIAILLPPLAPALIE